MIRTKRKALLISLGAVAMGLALFGCIACGKTDGPAGSQTTNFYFQTNGVELDMYETYKVPYVLEGKNASIAWESSNSEVARVSGGVITAVSEGTATVSATAGDFTAECLVKVYNSYTVPQISLGDVVYVDASETLTLPVEVKYKGNVIGYQDLAASEVRGGDVAQISVKANSLEIAGKSFGTAEYVISATANERTVAKTLLVECNDGSTVVIVENAKPTQGGWQANVLLADNGTGNMTEFTPEVKIYVNGKVTEKEISWSLSPGDAFYEAGGTYSPLKAGVQTLTGTFDRGQINIALVAIRPVFEMSEHLLVELADELKLAGVTGTVSSVMVENTDVFLSYNEVTRTTKLNLAALTDPAKMGEKTVTVVTDRAEYIYPNAEVYSDVITDESELNDFLSNAVKAKSTGDANGYFVLGGNIKCTGVYRADLGSFGAGLANGFRGIFDGRGYAIDGLNASGDRGGFINTLGSGGVIRNIVFTNASVTGNNAFIASNSYGEISNLYIEITMTNNDATVGSAAGDRRSHTSALVSEVQEASVINKCMVVYKNTVAEGASAQSGHIFTILRGTVKDLVVVGHQTLTWKDSDSVPATLTNVKTYANREALLADGNLSAIAGGFVNAFWTTDASGAPYPANYPTELLAPVLVKNSAAKTISWQPVAGAVGYEVVYNNGLSTVITDTQVDGSLITESGLVRVRALADSHNYSSNYAEVEVFILDGEWLDNVTFVNYRGISVAKANNASGFSVQGGFGSAPVSVQRVMGKITINGEAAAATFTFEGSDTVTLSAISKGGAAYTPAVGDRIALTELTVQCESEVYYFGDKFEAVYNNGTWYEIANNITLSINPGSDWRSYNIILLIDGGTVPINNNPLSCLVKTQLIRDGVTSDFALTVISLDKPNIIQILNFTGTANTRMEIGDKIVICAGSVIFNEQTKLAYAIDKTHTFSYNDGGGKTGSDNLGEYFGRWSLEISD